MPARPILLYPDPLLRQVAAVVDDFGSDLSLLAADLTDTLLAVSAIGLAGPHIGALQRVVVARLEPGGEARTYVNPVVAWASPELASHEEGSVSMPGMRDTITRPERVRIRFQTITGDTQEEPLAGFPAAVLQHEIDQLDGVFWIDRLSRLKRDRLLKRYSKLRASR